MPSGLEQEWAPSDRASAREEGDFLGTVFDRLDEAGVGWALLRGRTTLGMPGGDVDLLVSADDLDSFEDVVFEMGAFQLPRVRMPGSWSQAVLRHPWHRFYVLPGPSSGTATKLDVVTQLVYHRQLRLVSDLERGCLERRLEDGGVRVLAPTDTFWTVLLHCLLDKQKVTPRHAAELESVVAQVRRPSPGEEFFETLCPPGCSADQALSAVRNRDWDRLAGLGEKILRSAGSAGGGTPAAAAPSRPRQRALARWVRSGGGTLPRLDRAVRAAAVAAYPVLWRRAGLGAVPRVLDVLEAGAVDATVLLLRRRPVVCDVVALVPEEQRASLGVLLRAEHYVPVAGRWHRVTSLGLERLRVVTAEHLALPREAARRLRDASTPMAGRVHCRRARGTAQRPAGVLRGGGNHGGH